MAEIQLALHELFNREVPNLCIRCGRPQYGVVERDYAVQHYTRGWRSRTTETRTLTVPIPVCKRHFHEEDETEAVAIGRQSIVLDGVSRRFVDALWDLRDEREHADQEPGRRRRSPRRRRREYEEERDMLYRGRSHTAGWVIGVIFGLLALGFAICIGLAGLLTGPRAGPGFGPGGGPPFGPLH